MPSPSDAKPSPSEMLQAISEKWEELDFDGQEAVHDLVHDMARSSRLGLLPSPSAQDRDDIDVLETRTRIAWEQLGRRQSLVRSLLREIDEFCHIHPDHPRCRNRHRNG